MSEPSLSRGRAEGAVALTLSEVPDDVVEIARQCVLDWLGVTLAGAGEDVSRIVTAELLESTASAGATGATVVGRTERLGIHDAALANGTASHALDYDDVNESMYGHPSVPILAGLLALGEWRGASGAESVGSGVSDPGVMTAPFHDGRQVRLPVTACPYGSSSSLRGLQRAPVDGE